MDVVVVGVGIGRVPSVSDLGAVVNPIAIRVRVVGINAPKGLLGIVVQTVTIGVITHIQGIGSIPDLLQIADQVTVGVHQSGIRTIDIDLVAVLDPIIVCVSIIGIGVIQDRIKQIGNSRDLSAEKGTLAELVQALKKVRESSWIDPRQRDRTLRQPRQDAGKLRAALDRILLEDAVKIDCAAQGKEVPAEVSQYIRNIAALRNRLRAVEALIKAGDATSDDQDAIMKGIRDTLAELPEAPVGDAMLSAMESVVDLGGQLDKVTALLEHRRAGLQRIKAMLDGLDLMTLYRKKPLWERFRNFAAVEWSTENLLFWEGLQEGRFSSPRARQEAYWLFIDPDNAIDKVNLPKMNRNTCFPGKVLPTRERDGDWGYWAQVSYMPIKKDLSTNISDTFLRFRYTLHEPVLAELKQSHLRDCRKVIAKWEARLS